MYVLRTCSTLCLLLLDDGGQQLSTTNILDAGLAGASKAELGRNTLNAVSRVDVLDHGDLPAGSTSLTGSDGRVGKEVFPDLSNVSYTLFIR